MTQVIRMNIGVALTLLMGWAIGFSGGVYTASPTPSLEVVAYNLTLSFVGGLLCGYYTMMAAQEVSW